MKVGDLVKVYDFSHRARARFARQGQNTGDFHVGMILTKGWSTAHLPQTWEIVIPKWGAESRNYAADRLEVISESR